ncbi:MAG: hypothetical protein M3033_05225, partial [Acidobacteriota bacterium]|nr:hypothetical protein [Acidobacteriota bacterium]
NQVVAVFLTIAFAAAGSFVILKLVDLIFGLRVGEQHEIDGLDLTQHGEIAYVYARTELPSLTGTNAEEVGKLNIIPSGELVFETSE